MAYLSLYDVIMWGPTDIIVFYFSYGLSTLHAIGLVTLTTRSYTYFLLRTSSDIVSKCLKVSQTWRKMTTLMVIVTKPLLSSSFTL